MSPDKEKLACELYVQGVPVKEIGERLSYAPSAIYRVLRKYNGCSKSAYPNLARWLKDNNKSQEMAAFDLDISRNAFSQLLMGGNPTKRTIDKILAYTGMTYEQCFAQK